MKEHGSKLPAEQPAKILKSLLKKPGQTKARSQKNRVVINEKLNEFFAADYIILIKEECCADYEEDCDCCCQEHEFLRLGNCKECRAELNLHFGISDDNDPRYRDVERDEEITLGRDVSRDKGCDGERFDCGELHAEDAEEEEEEEDEEEEEEEDEEEYEGEECEIGDEGEEVVEDAMEGVQRKKGRKPEMGEIEPQETAAARDKKKRTDEFRTDASNRRQMAEPRDTKPCMVSVASTTTSLASSPPSEPPPPPPPPPPPRPQSTLDRSMYPSPLPRQEPQQQETLSPPEGYKDVCSNGEEPAEVPTQCLRSSLDHLRSRRAPVAPVEERPAYDRQKSEEDDAVGNAKKVNEPPQRTTSTEARHRYLVETITMTTVTERRIVREISEEKECIVQRECVDRSSDEKCDKKTVAERIAQIEAANDAANPIESIGRGEETSSSRGAADNRDETTTAAKLKRNETVEDVQEDRLGRGEASSDMKELSLVFKIGNSSLANNSLKPNSAVRQLFPNPKFVSPPPAPPGKLSVPSASSPDDSQDDNLSVSNDNPRILDPVKRSKTFDNHTSNSFNDDSDLIKRTIERNTLRRSLLDKYRSSSRKKNPPSKHLSLEERIRQLTCVDQDEDDSICSNVVDNTDSVASADIDADLLERDSPSGQEEIVAFPFTRPLVRNATTIIETSVSPTLTPTTTPTPTPTSTLPMPAAMPIVPGFDVSDATLPATGTSMAATFLASNSSFTSVTTTITASNYHKQNSVGGGGSGSSSGSSTISDQSHNHSTYKKLADLFVHKKHSNMPDLGLGSNGKNSIGKECQQSKNSVARTNHLDVRRQFLASLSPLSCVTVNSADNQEDYYRHDSRPLPGENRDPSTNYNNATSPYSLEDIEAALRENDRNYVGAPDVTKGTPMIINKPDIGDNATDELLAFVEQDKFRTERIKRRYNEVDDHYFTKMHSINAYAADSRLERIVDGRSDRDENRQQFGHLYHDDLNSNRGNYENKTRTDAQRGNDLRYSGNNEKRGESIDNNDVAVNTIDNENNDDDADDDEDDELNDYGFNRRPSVTGIKQRLANHTSVETFHRTILENDALGVPKTNYHSPQPTYYENNSVQIDGRIRLYDETTIDNATPHSFIGTLLTDDRDANTINRINTMQKQIDDIYQTIVENTNVAGQTTLERVPYTEDSTFVRQQHAQLPVNEAAFHFYQEQKNGQQYFQEQLNAVNAVNARHTRGVAAGAEEMDSVIAGRDYAMNNIPPNVRRRDPPAVVTTLANNRCNIMPVMHSEFPPNGKCYRTMYFVPYNGLSDPTYQNIQRILPAHPSPSYATHIERYPYPRSNKTDPLQPRAQSIPAPQQQQLQQQQLRYYHIGNRPLAPLSNFSQANISAPLPPGSIGVHQVPPGTSTFDSRLASISSPDPVALQPALQPTLQPAQQTLHLHLHQHQQTSEDFRISGVAFASDPRTAEHSLQLHHHHHHHQHQHQRRNQPTFYQIPPSTTNITATSASSSYTVIAPTRCATLGGSGLPNTENSYRFYQLHLGRTVVTPAAELQSAQTFLSSSTSTSTSIAPCTTAFSQTVTPPSSSSSFSSSMPTSYSPLPTVTGIASQQASMLVLPNHVTENPHGPAQPDTNHMPVSKPGLSTTTPSSSSSSSSNSSSSCSSSCSFSSSSSSSCSPSSMQIPGSPSKQQHHQQHQQSIGTSYAVIERGVPEGAASTGPPDVSQPGILLTSNPYVARNPSGVSLPSHVQNSVYYAMNV